MVERMFRLSDSLILSLDLLCPIAMYLQGTISIYESHLRYASLVIFALVVCVCEGVHVVRYCMRGELCLSEGVAYKKKT